MPTKSELAQEAAIKAVLAAGYVADGETRFEASRRKTGEVTEALVTAGGRQRFALSGTPHKVTIGPRTTNFYQFDKGKDKEAHGFKYLDTSDLAAITTTAQSIGGQ